MREKHYLKISEKPQFLCNKELSESPTQKFLILDAYKTILKFNMMKIWFAFILGKSTAIAIFNYYKATSENIV